MVKSRSCLGVLILVIIFLLLGCNSGMYDLLSRTPEDPFVVKPEINSFLQSNTVIAKWAKDAGADEYLLERAEDNNTGLLFEIVYRGIETEYSDYGLEDGTRYIYRLSKRRGVKWFGPSEEVLGVGSQVSRKSYVNDTMERAFQLETKHYISNLYYYRSSGGLELSGEAWYYIDIPPLRRASLVVRDFKVTVSDTPTHFEYYEYERGSSPILQLSSFWIVNEKLETERYYIKLYPAREQFVGSSLPAGGYIVQYQISIGNIEPYK